MDDDTQAAKGALSSLIELERRIENELAAAEAEAAQIVEAAAAEARSFANDDGALAVELAALREAVERDAAAVIRRLEGDARAAEERYRGVDDAQLDALARWLTLRVLGGGADA